MKRLLRSMVLATVGLVVAGTAGRADEAVSTALKDYVAKPDPTYSWRIRSEKVYGKVIATELILTSQTWRGIVWKHQLVVMRPAELMGATDALLLVSGGDWKTELDGPANPSTDRMPAELGVLAGVVSQVNTPVAILNHVPFQPVFDGMVEDQIIAYTFDEYLKSQDPEWPLLLPMVKSAVKAMDAVQEFAKQEWRVEVKDFTVTGASKRGWTTWLTGAVEPRAKAIAPMVIDMLNTTRQMEHQLATWGKYSEQIEDYTKRGIQGQNQTPAGKALSLIVDPYSYRSELTQPKLLIMGTNDRYWVLDALNLYWDDLLGEKYVLYIPNNGHGLSDYNRLIASIGALHRHMMGRLELPKLDWKFTEADGRIALEISSDQTPKSVVLWSATAPTKDLREARWSSQPIPASGDKYRHEIEIPSAGFTGLFGELVFPDGTGQYYLSTNVRVVGTQPAPVGAAGN